MADAQLGGILELIWPDFGMIFSGTDKMITPVLVVLIWALTVIACGYTWREARRAKALVGEGESLVKDLTPDNLWAMRSDVRARSQSKDGSPVLANAWRDFDDALVVDQSHLYNTVGAAEFFDEQRFAPKLIGNRLLQAAPTALTTLGLLGTFLGLTIGLRGLELDAPVDQLRSGMQILVDGAALGFTASLWGVAMSLVTNLVQRLLERGVVTRVRELQGRVDGLFRMRSPEQSLSDIASHTDESREALQVLHEKVGTALQESIRSVGEDTGKAVSDAIRATLTPIMSELTQMAADQSANVFKEVSTQLTASFAEMGISLATQLRESSESMAGTLDRIGSSLEEHAGQHRAQMTEMHGAAARHLQTLQTSSAQQLQQLHETAADHLIAVTDASARQTQLLDRALPRVIEALDRAASLVGSATSGMESATMGLTKVTTDLGTTSEALGGMLSDAIGTMGELASTTATAAGGLASQQDAVANLAETALVAAASLRAASVALNDGFGQMNKAQAAFLEDLERRLGEHSEAMSGWLATYADDVSKQTARRMDEWNTHTESFTSTMLHATQALSYAVDELDVQRAPVANPIAS